MTCQNKSKSERGTLVPGIVVCLRNCHHLVALSLVGWTIVKLVNLLISLPRCRHLNWFTTSSTVSGAPLPSSPTVYHAVDVAFFTLEKLKNL